MDKTWRRPVVAAVALTIGIAGLSTACSSGEREAPTSTTTTPASTSAAPPSPTEKGAGGGPNTFTPTVPVVKAPPAPTATPGHHN